MIEIKNVRELEISNDMLNTKPPPQSSELKTDFEINTNNFDVHSSYIVLAT